MPGKVVVLKRHLPSAGVQREPRADSDGARRRGAAEPPGARRGAAAPTGRAGPHPPSRAVRVPERAPAASERAPRLLTLTGLPRTRHKRAPGLSGDLVLGSLRRRE